MKLTNTNYFSPEANQHYLSTSQFKAFLKCEAEAQAELSGIYRKKPSKALMVGSYVDAWFSGESEQFMDENPEIFNKRTGELKAEFRQADTIIERAKRDKVFMDAMSGDPQVVMTAELFGHPFKIKMDSYHEDRIVDLKVMRDMKPVYKDGEWRTFIDAWGYDIQGFIYQQVCKAVTGKELPFYLAVLTKEEHPDIALIHIPQWKLNSAGAVVEHYADRFARIKLGEIEPKRCGVCGWCRDTKTLTGAIEYEELMETDL